MTPRMKSIAIVLGTLLAGMALGGVIVGAISQKRVHDMRDVRRPGGFVRHMEDIIGPTDEAQRAAILPLLVETDGRNRSIVDGARRQMRVAFDSMMTKLAPMLTEEQMERLRDEVRRRESSRRPPPGLRGPFPPHDGGPPGRE